MAKLTFLLQIMSLKGLLFEDQVESVYLSGDDGEFELMPFHHPLVASIPEGEIKIAKFDSIPIKVGILVFKENKCQVIVEAHPDFKNFKEIWEIQ